MEAKDFRIDNLVYGPDKTTVCRVKYIDGEEDTISTDNFSERHSEEYTAIRLTEEYLLRSGLEKSMLRINLPPKVIEDEVWHIDELICIHYNENEYCLMGEYDGMCWFMRKLKGIHDLQNLYFALTGKELTLKEN